MSSEELADDLAERLERILGDEGGRTLREISDERGVRVEDMVATRRALGLTVDLDAPIYGAALEDHARRLEAALSSGVPFEALVALNRVIGRAMNQITDAAADLVFAAAAGTPTSNEEQRAFDAAELVTALTPELERVLSYAFREHARELVRREAGALVSAKRAARLQDIAVGFADLVGYTGLGEQVTPERLTEVAVRLEGLAAGVLPPHVQLVKTIGDAVMLASVDPAALVQALLDLVAAATEEGPDYPRLRAGAALGPAVQRAADWYGSAVNLASRLTSSADPGELVCTARLAERAPSIGWAAGGTREVRGFDVPVVTQVARPTAAAAGS